MQGRLVTFEGLDGCGKSTQIRLLAAKLSSAGIPFLETREPGVTMIGEEIRRLVLSCDYGKINTNTELLLFFANRAQHYAEVLKPSLARGKIVICDRFIDTTIAYQGYAREIDFAIIEYLHKLTTDNLMPDLTFFLDLPPDKCLIRRQEQDRIEREKIEFLNSVYTGFLLEAKHHPNRIKRVNADRDIKEIEREIWTEIQKFLGISRG